MALVQVAQYAADLDRAAAWYTMLLGRGPTARFEPPGLLFFDLDGTRLLLDGNAPSALLYLRVDDVEAEVARLEAAGVEVVTAPHAILLVVPPDQSQPTWNAEALQKVLLETMDLVRVRAVGPEALGELGQYLPALYFALNLAGDTVSTDFLRLPS